MNKKIHKHIMFYLGEILIVGGAFSLLLLYKFGFAAKLMIVGIMLTSYIVLGLLHHKMNNDIKGKIVLEYILISLIIFALFLFTNITKL